MHEYKLKVGDKVEILDTNTTTCKIGDTGEIKGLYMFSSGRVQYEVEINGDQWSFYKEHLALVDKLEMQYVFYTFNADCHLKTFPTYELAKQWIMEYLLEHHNNPDNGIDSWVEGKAHLIDSAITTGDEE